jgi:riboflavin biosynthesis pyrimidine reductase
MAISVDGRIVVDGWPGAVAAAVRREYEVVHASYAADGWICGRVTMEPFAGGVRTESAIAQVYADGAPRDDYSAPGDHASFAVAVDPRGRLAWSTNDIDGDHVVSLLSSRVSDEYLGQLRRVGVSYVLAGDGDEVDLALALGKVGARFGVRTLMLEGGGGINGSFARAGLIDEVSLLVAPVADGRVGTPALFDVAGERGVPWRLALTAVERRADDVLWLRYRVVDVAA